MRQSNYTGLKGIACMLMKLPLTQQILITIRGSHSTIRIIASPTLFSAHILLTQHILTTYIKCLLLVGIVTAQVKAYFHRRGHLTMGTQCSKGSTKHILLLTFVVNGIFHCILHGTKTSHRGIRNELITILREVTQQSCFPRFIKVLPFKFRRGSYLPRHLCLVVHEVRTIVTFGI